LHRKPVLNTISIHFNLGRRCQLQPTATLREEVYIGVKDSETAQKSHSEKKSHN
jgi:hypothetical protein